MANFINWVTVHVSDLIQLYLAIVGLASIIVKLTPTLKDDDVFKKVISFIGKYLALDKYGPNGEVK